MPSPRPSAPRPSVLLAFTETATPGHAQGPADRARASRRDGGPGPAPARSTVASTFPSAKPRSRDERAPRPPGTRRLGAPFQRASLLGKCAPMSPAPGAPEEGVADRVQQAVAVRVALEPASNGTCTPPEHAAGGPAPGGARRSRCRRGGSRLPPPRGQQQLSAQARSSGVVILRLRGEPGTAATGGPDPLDAPSPRR